jgi:hypothetical protein
MALESDKNAVFFSEEDKTLFMAVHGQRSGICSSHASVTFQHEVASVRKPKDQKDHKMLDISDFIRNHLPPDRQRKYIETGATGLNSFDLIQTFTGTKVRDYIRYQPNRKDDSEPAHNQVIQNLVGWFRSVKKPGLVSEFKIENKFLQNVVLEKCLDESAYETYKMERNGEKERLRAMVLIGVYEYDRRYWFVLQNSHIGDFFKVVDAEYLASCGGHVSFALAKTDMSLKGNYHLVDGEYIEAASRMEECFAEEAHAEG